MSETEREIVTQPRVWRQVLEHVPALSEALPDGSARAAFVGCGTSFYVAQAAAALREESGRGVSDSFPASEIRLRRHYDVVVAISRSGTTTEVLRALERLAAPAGVVAITAVAGTPLGRVARSTITLTGADESSVVQTRFATSVLALMRARVGHDVRAVADAAERAIAAPLPVDPGDFERFVFLSSGWSLGLAHEAALKMREAAGAWAESYPALEYRHGPISVVGPRTVVWCLTPPGPSLAADITSTGATVVAAAYDPMVELVRVQRTAVALAEVRGLDPDRPAHLTRSVTLA